MVDEAQKALEEAEALKKVFLNKIILFCIKWFTCSATFINILLFVPSFAFAVLFFFFFLSMIGE